MSQTAASPPLFTPRFWLLCTISLIGFLAAFQLYPTAPFHILMLGGNETEAGMFLGLMTYASAGGALFTGALADQLGKRRMLIVCSSAAALCSASYAVIPTVYPMLAVVVVHGVFWSGLMTATGGYLGDIIPSHRRAEGMGYYGASTVLALAVAPAIGLWIYRFGWPAVCLSAAGLNALMAAVACTLPDTDSRRQTPLAVRGAFEWRVLALSGTLFLYYFGYGGVTSFAALYASANGVTPPGLYFSVFAASALTTTLLAGPLGDRIGHVRVLIPAMVLIAIAYALLAMGGTRGWLITSAVVFGLAFRAAYQLFTAHVLHLVGPERRGAAFGGIIAALDTGVGTGSITMGWIVGRYGYARAFAVAAGVAALAVPYFLTVNARIGAGDRSDGPG